MNTTGTDAAATEVRIKSHQKLPPHCIHCGQQTASTQSIIKQYARPTASRDARTTVLLFSALLGLVGLLLVLFGRRGWAPVLLCLFGLLGSAARLFDKVFGPRSTIVVDVPLCGRCATEGQIGETPISNHAHSRFTAPLSCLCGLE